MIPDKVIDKINRQIEELLKTSMELMARSDKREAITAEQAERLNDIDRRITLVKDRVNQIVRLLNKRFI